MFPRIEHHNTGIITQGLRVLLAIILTMLPNCRMWYRTGSKLLAITNQQGEAVGEKER